MEELPYRKNIVALDQKVLVISDLHFPYAHPDWYAFLRAIKEAYKPDIVVNVGDEVDGHDISFHTSDSSLDNADRELEKAIKEIHYLRDLFPKMYLCESNHGSLAYRKVKSEGIPIRHLRELHELYETPGWQWCHEIMIETHLHDVLVVHGKTCGYNKFAMEQGCSTIQGHYHQKFEITWAGTSTSERFNMIVGCLINRNSMAFAYGKNFPKKPMLGVGWLTEMGEPVLIRMILDKHGRWCGKL